MTRSTKREREWKVRNKRSNDEANLSSANVRMSMELYGLTTVQSIYEISSKYLQKYYNDISNVSHVNRPDNDVELSIVGHLSSNIGDKICFAIMISSTMI